MDSRKVNDDMGIGFDEEKDYSSDEWISVDVSEPGNNNKSVSSRPISKTMLISEIVNQHPEIIPEIMNKGMHCIGCSASAFETLEEGFRMHGMDSEDIDRTISDLNKIIDQNSKPAKSPEPDDFY